MSAPRTHPADAALGRAIAWTAFGATLGWLAASAVRAARRIDLAGRTVLITGGSRGLGLLLARRAAAAGARVAICGRDAATLARAERDVARYGQAVLALPCDVTDRAAIEATVATVEDAWGGVDLLVNNAGVVQVGPQSAMTAEDYERAMQVHCFGPLHATLAVLPGMRRRGGGRIVNIASVGGLVAVPHMLPYSASKFALVGLSEGLRAELQGEGIYVTTVVPGLMRTGSAPHARFKGRHRAEYAWFSRAASTPLVAVDADHAADRILRAATEGRAHLTLSLHARLASLVHGVAPGLTAEAMALVNRVLPGAGGIGRAERSGAASRPAKLPSWLTSSGEAAGRRNNEVAG